MVVTPIFLGENIFPIIFDLLVRSDDDNVLMLSKARSSLDRHDRHAIILPHITQRAEGIVERRPLPPTAQRWAVQRELGLRRDVKNEVRPFSDFVIDQIENPNEWNIKGPIR